MLKTRIITAVVLLLGFSADLVFASIDVFALVLALVVAAAAWEWGRLCGITQEHGQTGFAAGTALFVLIALYIPHSDVLMRWVLLVGFLYWLLVPAGFYLSPKLAPIKSVNISLLSAGVLIMLVSAVAIQYLRSYAPQGSSWLLLYALSVTWVMDIGAYFSGRRFGKTKLAPLISPGKTWEGVYGGLLATFVLMIIVMLIADWAEGNYLKLILATALSAGASVIGDLSESRVKRAADRKDSSSMLPGHGGVLDRLDGVLAAAPVFAFVWAWM